ncbi:nitroreductase family protein [Labilibacter sediminis]|nr:nitroreductase family protein [Labilibacter sediminis]
MLKDLILKNRSYRRFYQDETISEETLTELIDLARLSPSARNAQPLKYIICNKPEVNNTIFKYLSWAGYLPDWHGPEEGERPSAYIIMLNDTSISSNFFSDNGIASQSILLGAVEKGLGGCIIGSVERLQLQRSLDIPSKYKIVQVIALGKPKEEVVIEELDKDHKYWRDMKDVHHVPKRSLQDIVLKL